MDELGKIKSIINLRDIKSSYIIQKIFNFLYEKQRLNMIIYNNKLQKILVVNIEDYKKISGKYKIGGKNGKGSVYLLDTNKLIFEGEYINGKRNGNGKEYYYYYNKRILIFEGEYSDGKRNGKGKEYFNNGELKFEGEYHVGPFYPLV